MCSSGEELLRLARHGLGRLPDLGEELIHALQEIAALALAELLCGTCGVLAALAAGREAEQETEPEEGK